MESKRKGGKRVKKKLADEFLCGWFSVCRVTVACMKSSIGDVY
jgi:hypothetical protein